MIDRYKHYSILLVFLVGVEVYAQPTPALSCPEAASGLVSLLEPGNVLLLGEMHGTNESPRFLKAALCNALQRGNSVTVGLEMPRGETTLLEAYLTSQGTEDAVNRFLEGSFWQRSAQDGRTSQAMLTVVEAIRVYKEMGLPIHAILIDDASVSHRDSVMSAQLQAAVASSPQDVFLVLTGNIHNRLTPGTSWDASFEPMGYLLRQALPEQRLIALNVSYQEGEAWVCFPDKPCGIGRLRGKAGPESGVELFDGPPGRAYDGLYYVGRLTASIPAIQSRKPVER